MKNSLLALAVLSCFASGLAEAQLQVLQEWEGDVGTFVNTTPTYKDHPDPVGDVGPNHVVHMTGQSYIVYDLNGKILQQITSTKFFNNAGAAVTGGADEPRIAFDSFIGRWIAVVSDSGSGNDFVAVSAGADPTSSDTTAWKAIAVTPSGVKDDTLRLGWDKNGAYVTNYDGKLGNGNYALNVFSPAALKWVGMGAIGNPTRFPSVEFEMFPTTDTDPQKAATDPAIILYRSPGTQNLTNAAFAVQLHPITWANGVPSLGAAMSLPSGYLYNTPINASQPGGGSIRSAENHRGFAAWGPGGALWAVFASGPCTAQCGNSPMATHDGFYWFEIDPVAMKILDKGYVFDGTMDHSFPTIVVDQDGNAVIATTCSDANNTFLSVCAFYRRPIDPAGKLTGPTILKAGSATYPGGCKATNPPGWGLWTTATTDQADRTKIWLHAEYGEFPTVCKWATRVLEIQLQGNGGMADAAFPVDAATLPDLAATADALPLDVGLGADAAASADLSVADARAIPDGRAAPDAAASDGSTGGDQGAGGSPAGCSCGLGARPVKAPGVGLVLLAILGIAAVRQRRSGIVCGCDSQRRWSGCWPRCGMEPASSRARRARP